MPKDLFDTLIILVVAVVILVPVAYTLVAVAILKSMAMAIANGNKTQSTAPVELLTLLSFLGPPMLRSTCYDVVTALHFMNGKHEETIADCRNCLAKPQQPLIEARMRARMADSLQALKRTDEANAEREAAVRLLQSLPKDYTTLHPYADILVKQGRRDEAVEALQLGLSSTPADKSLEQAHYMNDLMSIAVKQDAPEETLRWAEAAIAAGAIGLGRCNCHRIAGNIRLGRGELDRAREHADAALKLAGSELTARARSGAWAYAATVELYYGRLSECEAAADRSIGFAGEARLGREVKCISLFHRGMLGDALAEIEQVKSSSLPAKADFVPLLAIASIAVEQGDVRRAADALERAASIPALNPRMVLRLDAASARLLALAGMSGEADAKLADLRTRAEEYPGEILLQLTALVACGRVEMAFSRYASARTYFARCLEMNRYPLLAPIYHYFHAECAQYLGNSEEADRHYFLGAGYNRDIAYAQKCADKLAAHASG